MTTADRVGELLDGIKRPVRKLTSPEGVELNIQIASRGERMAAFVIDMTFLLLAVLLIYFIGLLVFFSRVNLSVGLTFISFVMFIVRNMYFLHFELAWQGRTPGKRICGIRVASGSGGELTPAALIARNLMREAEFFLPVSLFFGLGDLNGWSGLAAFGWAALLTALPFFNRDRLRAGDIIAGTIVIKMPKRTLLGDLASTPLKREGAKYSFKTEQLAVYGAFELQVLEELLRREPTPEVGRVLSDVCSKIRRKIGMAENIPPQNVREFLNDFYLAERGMLERGQLFGYYKDDKKTRRRKI
ncbi:MAG: RDD family protein, partial [Synergistaceae bacterium]|nr:RDD family protein [Synergistaceae bacterium]